MNSTASSNLSQRERRLLMFLPAIFAVIIYFWMFTTEPNKKLKNLVKQVETAERSAPTQRDIQGEMMRGAELQRQLDEAQKALNEVQLQLSQVTSAWSNATARVGTSDELTALLRRHELVPIDVVRLPDGDANLAPRMARVASHMKPVLGASAPQAWEVRLQGGYLPVLEALKELGESRLMILPLSISMTNSPDGSSLLWSLKLWM